MSELTPEERERHQGQVYAITQVLFLGRFPTLNRVHALRHHGITHVFNVSHSRGALTAEHGFELDFVPLYDYTKLKADKALKILRRLHAMASVPGSRVYVHCTAGVNRSATILWLYLMACGLGEAEARQRIVSVSRAALANYRALPEFLRSAVADYGAEIQPLERPELIAACS